MKLWWCFLIFLVVCTNNALSKGMIEVFRWKQMEYEDGSKDGKPPGIITFPGATNKRQTSRFSSHRNQGYNMGQMGQMVPQSSSDYSDYIAYNNVPMGATHHNGRLFITMPRRRTGIPSTLNYIDMSEANSNPSPRLKAYPNLEVNQLNPTFQKDASRIISVYRTRIDACNRMWFIDTGMLEYPNNRMQVQEPSIWIIDISNDQVIRRFEIPENIVTEGNGLPSITIDVDKNNCNDAFAYIPDLVNARLYVYSFKSNSIWSFTHNYLSYDPLYGDFNIGGQEFQWDDGIFSLTLGNVNPDGFRTAYFHAMASISEFMVSTEVLRNETNAARSYHGRDFKFLANRGQWTQSTMHEFDPRTGIIFYDEIATNSVGCFNVNKPFTTMNHGVIHSDAKKMIYPSDLMIDTDGFIWVMSNTMPVFIYSNLNPNEFNFRVWKQSVLKAAENTPCI